MKDTAVAVLGVILIALILYSGAAFFMPMPLVLSSGGITLGVGIATTTALFRARGRSTAGVLGAFVLGTFLKLGGLTAIFFVSRRLDAPSTPPLLVALCSFLFFYVWTSYRFHVSSQR